MPYPTLPPTPDLSGPVTTGRVSRVDRGACEVLTSTGAVHLPLDSALLQRLRKATGIKVGYRTVDQKPVDLTLKLDGFAKSFDQIK